MQKFLLFISVLLFSINIDAKDNEVPEIWGNIIEMTSWDAMSDNNKPFGVYSFPAQAEGFKFTKLTPQSMNFYPTGNGIITSDGTYHFCVYEFDDWAYEYYTQLYTYDINTWNIIGKPKDVPESFRAFDLTQDPTDGTVYGMFVNGEKARFGTIDYATNTQKTIADLDTTFYGIACSNEGKIYAISLGGNLYEITKEGRMNLIGSLGLKEQGLTIQDRVQSATFDPKTNKMYWAAYLWDEKAISYKTALYEIDTQTGKAKFILDFPELAQVVALYIPAPKAQDGAPAEATNLTASFEGAALTGKVAFTAPSSTYDGNPLDGILSYSISTGGQELTTGTCLPGENVDAEVTVTKGGKTNFVVRTSNAVGKSPASSVTSWVSYDNTTAPQSVKFDYDGAQATITWSAPVTTLHGGYIDNNNLTYNIIRYPDNKQVATAIKGLSYQEPLSSDSYKKYAYGVTAVNGGLLSDTTVSSQLAIGPAYTIPYSEDFSRSNAFDDFTSVDVNGDKRYEEMWGYVVENSGYWGVSSESAAVYRGGSNQADDWMLTPLIQFQKDKYYKLSFDAKRDVERYNEELSVGIGKAMSFDHYNMLVTKLNPMYDAYDTYSYVFTVPSNGAYNIGFHATSPALASFIFIDNIKIEEISKEIADGIQSLQDNHQIIGDVYSLSGVCIRHAAHSLSSLPKGIYIVKGKKVAIR